MPTPLHHLNLDFTDLRLFLHVVEAGSITVGAQRSHLALASASARVRGLEEAAGLPLFRRHRSGVTPTQAGLALAHHARLVLQQMQQLQHELRGHMQGLLGVARLACNTATLTEYLPPVLAPLLAHHPGLDVDVQELPSHTIVERLLANGVDLGLVADVVDTAPLETRPFRADRLVLITPPRHALARRKGVDFTEALAHDFVALDDASAMQQHLNLQAQRQGRRLHARIRLRDFGAVAALVAAGVGVAVLPEVTARRLAAAGGKFSTVPLRDPWTTRRLLLCARRFAELPPPALLLAQALGGAAAPG